MTKHTECYKTLEIDMDDAVQRLHTHFAPCLVPDAPGIYWDCSYLPVIRADDECTYIINKVAYSTKQLMDSVAAGIPTMMRNHTVYKQISDYRTVVVIPQGSFNHSRIRLKGEDSEADQWFMLQDFQGVAATVFTALMGDYIRDMCNSPYHPRHLFDVTELLLPNMELGMMALSDHAIFDVDAERYSRLIQQGTRTGIDYDTVVSEIGKDVADRLIMNMRKCVSPELEKITQWIGPHIDNTYTYRIIGRKYILSQGVDYRAQQWIDQTEADTLSSIE